MSKECLVIGPESSGKTLLIRKIKSINNNSNGNDNDNEITTVNDEDTMPTVGVDINTITLNNENIILREIGGAMISRWSTFIETCDTLIFVIDMSNMSLLSTSLVLLMEMYTIIMKSSKKLQDIAISFTKTDLTDITSQKIVKNTLSIDGLIIEGKRNGISINILEGNAIDDSLALQCINYINELFVCNI